MWQAGNGQRHTRIVRKLFDSTTDCEIVYTRIRRGFDCRKGVVLFADCRKIRQDVKSGVKKEVLAKKDKKNRKQLTHQGDVYEGLLLSEPVWVPVAKNSEGRVGDTGLEPVTSRM